MSATTTKTDTLAAEINKGNVNTFANALGKVKLGNVLTPIKVTFASLSSAAAIDITTAASKAAATITGLSLATGENLPPILSVTTLRVTAGAAGAGPRTVTDAGGTAVTAGATGNTGVAGVALLSDDGKTLTFETTVTGFVLEYIPRAAADVTAAFAS